MYKKLRVYINISKISWLHLIIDFFFLKDVPNAQSSHFRKVKQFYPKFSLERLIPIIETATCRFW